MSCYPTFFPPLKSRVKEREREREREKKKERERGQWGWMRGGQSGQKINIYVRSLRVFQLGLTRIEDRGGDDLPGQGGKQGGRQ